MDNKENIIEKVRIYKDLVKSLFPVKIENVYLFGSYAKGTPHKDSDIDVALVVRHLDENYSIWDTEPLLWKIGRQVDFRISPVVVALDTDYTGFYDEIQQTGILIN
ncbi:MAG: nucleotidyltransferase domain-containing protein [Tannerella sp.]|jgi:predicted nucleotidyltransferase|nr:nucleotidyltransferase domain-containing protein [Tannerella sp.]